MKLSGDDRIRIIGHFEVSNTMLARSFAAREILGFQKRRHGAELEELVVKIQQDRKVIEIEDGGWEKWPVHDEDASRYVRTINVWVKPTLFQRLKRLLGMRAVTKWTPTPV